MNYVAYCLENPEKDPDIDDWIDRWHHGDGKEGETLHEFLGFTWEEYAEWVRDPGYAAKVLAARRYVAAQSGSG